MRSPIRWCVFALASVVCGCGGRDGDVFEERETVSAPVDDPCRVATADALATADPSGVRLFSGDVAYSRERACARFVADVVVTTSNAIKLLASHYGSSPNSAQCSSLVVDAQFYEREDTLADAWVEGSFRAIGAVRLRGAWIGTCQLIPERGGFPTTTSTADNRTRKVARIAVEAHVESSGGNLEGLSVLAGTTATQ